MLSVMCEVFAMAPITFGIAGYVLVSRDGAVTPALPPLQYSKDFDTLTD